jgi:hypothetical protein
MAAGRSRQRRHRRVNFEDETASLANSMTKKLPNMRLQRSIEFSSMSKSCTPSNGRTSRRRLLIPRMRSSSKASLKLTPRQVRSLSMCPASPQRNCKRLNDRGKMGLWQRWCFASARAGQFSSPCRSDRCDDSLRLPRRGRATIDAGVSSHTVRSVHPQKPSSRSKPLRDRMARLANPVVFFPAVLCCGTRRNAIWLQTCKRTTDLFSHGRVKTEMRDGRWAARMRIPMASRARGLSPTAALRQS